MIRGLTRANHDEFGRLPRIAAQNDAIMVKKDGLPEPISLRRAGDVDDPTVTGPAPFDSGDMVDGGLKGVAVIGLPMIGLRAEVEHVDHQRAASRRSPWRNGRARRDFAARAVVAAAVQKDGRDDPSKAHHQRKLQRVGFANLNNP